MAEIHLRAAAPADGVVVSAGILSRTVIIFLARSDQSTEPFVTKMFAPSFIVFAALYAIASDPQRRSRGNQLLAVLPNL